MADSLGTLCIASANGGSTTVTLVASGTCTITVVYSGDPSSKTITLPDAAVFSLCRPYLYGSSGTPCGVLAIISGSTASATYNTGSNILVSSVSMASAGNKLTFTGWFKSGSLNSGASWEYYAFK